MATTYQSPGVYIEEVPAGPKPIAGTPTGVLAIVGKTERGPVLVPRRLTGFGELEATFGGIVLRSHVLPSVWGFFENGGGVCYVVRCDPSSTATWSVTNGASPEAEVMEIRALSAGAWANDLVVTIARQEGGGTGSRPFARLVGTGNLQLPATAGQVDVDVASTTGFQVGDTATLIDPVAQPEVRRDVTIAEILSPTRLRLDHLAGTAAELAREASALVARLEKDLTTVVLSTAAGFKVGDIVATAVPGVSTRREARVEEAVVVNQAMRLRLAAGFGADVPAAGFAPRRLRHQVRFRVRPADPAAVSGADVVASDPLAPADLVATDRLYAYGVEARFASNQFTFPAPVRDGAGELETDHSVRTFSQPISIPAPTRKALEDALADQFKFLPLGTKPRLTSDEISEPLVVERKGDGFDAGPAGAIPKVTFQELTIPVPAEIQNGVVLQSARAPEVGDFVAFPDNGVRRINEVTVLAPTIYQLKFDGAALAAAPGVGSWPVRTWLPTRFAAQRFGIVVRRADWSELERFDGLSTEPTHPSYVARDRVVNGVSTRIEVLPPTTATTVAGLPQAAAVKSAGASRDPAVDDFRRGFAALERESEPDLVACPDALAFSDDPMLQAAVVSAMVGHCEDQIRFALIDAPDLTDDQALADWRATTVTSNQAAAYAPHLRMVNLDPNGTEQFVLVPPSGFVAGVISRTDDDRGVFKAPANERVRGIVGLAKDYTQREQDLLNPGLVNLVRPFRGRGIRVWGARTATDDTSWRYVNVRRLFNFLERSIRAGTQWVVFEPNDQRTWLRTRVSIEDFLHQVWRAGGLFGRTPEEAYRVRVGLGQTMTQADIDLGLFVVDVAVAAVRPAEFVVFRFSHKVETEGR